MGSRRMTSRLKRNVKGSPYNWVPCKMPTCGTWSTAREMFIKPGTKRVLICPDCAERLYGSQKQTV